MSYLDYCRPCHKYYDNTFLVECKCGLRMCKGCWLQYDYVCPICESDLKGEDYPE